MKTPLGTEVDLSAGHIVLDELPAPAKGAQQPLFSARLLWPRSPISATAELLLTYRTLWRQELGSSWDGRPWPQQSWAEKMGAAVPLSRRAGTPSNTMRPGPRSTSVPSGVFIHPVVW